MTEQNKGVFSAVVESNREIGIGFWKIKLGFEGAGMEAFAGFRPGQFAQLDISGAPLPPMSEIPEDLRDGATRQVILRRPFSFTDLAVGRKSVVAEILYCVVGPGTLRMTCMKAGDVVSVVGPLGNGFWVPEGKKTALLVVGGMGTAPLQHVAKYLRSDHPDIEVTAFAGAKTKKELPYERTRENLLEGVGFVLPEFTRHATESVVATDDGSTGYKGFVTDCMCQWLKEHRPKPAETILYACGPEVMLAAMAKISADLGIDCQVSMERRMACGTGLCQGCAVECKVADSEETVYKMCCQDGPVFDSREVVFGA